jgi:hypothetical protein
VRNVDETDHAAPRSTWPFRAGPLPTAFPPDRLSDVRPNAIRLFQRIMQGVKPSGDSPHGNPPPASCPPHPARSGPDRAPAAVPHSAHLAGARSPSWSASHRSITTAASCAAGGRSGRPRPSPRGCSTWRPSLRCAVIRCCGRFTHGCRRPARSPKSRLPPACANCSSCLMPFAGSSCRGTRNSSAPCPTLFPPRVRAAARSLSWNLLLRPHIGDSRLYLQLSNDLSKSECGGLFPPEVLKAVSSA